MKRLYLDNCCYNRPYDDLTQECVHLESEAIVAIIKRGQQHIDEIVGSDYTKEKYNHPDLSLEEIDILLRTNKKPIHEANR
jgi:hypothetical protein